MEYAIIVVNENIQKYIQAEKRNGGTIMSEIYDIAILGAGPAGITAAIYAARAKMNILWLDKQFAQGGQILNTY